VKAICNVAHIASKLGLPKALTRDIFPINAGMTGVVIIWKYPDAWSVALRKSLVLGVI